MENTKVVKKPIHHRIVATTKKVLVLAVVKPIIKISFISSEEKLFLNHAKRFLEPGAIKPEYRDKVK